MSLGMLRTAVGFCQRSYGLAQACFGRHLFVLFAGVDLLLLRHFMLYVARRLIVAVDKSSGIVLEVAMDYCGTGNWEQVTSDPAIPTRARPCSLLSWFEQYRAFPAQRVPGWKRRNRQEKRCGFGLEIEQPLTYSIQIG
jgi:hypothetical protein